MLFNPVKKFLLAIYDTKKARCSIVYLFIKVWQTLSIWIKNLYLLKHMLTTYSLQQQPQQQYNSRFNQDTIRNDRTTEKAEPNSHSHNKSNSATTPSSSTKKEETTLAAR